MPDTTARPHVLYVCWGFPPCRGSGVYRGLATANTLVDLGCDVTVITADRETFVRSTGVDESLEALIADGIEVVRVDFEWPEHQQEIDQWPLERAQDPRGWLERWNEAAVADFPEPRYGAWRRRIEAAADEIHRARPVDLVIATVNPNVDGAVGLHLSEAHGVPFVVDQRDAWTLNVLTENIDFTPDSPTGLLEARFMHEALEAWFVNEPIRDWHQQTYPDARDSMHVVMNGFDLDTAPEPQLAPADPETPLTVGYVGTITPYVPLAEALDGWVEGRAADARLRGAQFELYGHLGHFAAASPTERALLENAAEHGVLYGGPVGKSGLREIYDRFDVLLFAAGSGRYVTSGKVFEYMSTALPIVSCHVPGIAAEDVLRGYPLWFPVDDLAPRTIASALSAAAEAAVGADEAVRRACMDHAARFERGRQLRVPLQRVVDHAMGGAS